MSGQDLQGCSPDIMPLAIQAEIELELLKELHEVVQVVRQWQIEDLLFGIFHHLNIVFKIFLIC